MPNLYILSGCNGSGKTTSSFTVLPAVADCDIFINTDETSMLKDKCFKGTNTKGHVFDQICEFHRPYAINTKAIIVRHWKTKQ